jgi:hypothetical protein
LSSCLILASPCTWSCRDSCTVHSSNAKKEPDYAAPFVHYSLLSSTRCLLAACCLRLAVDGRNGKPRWFRLKQHERPVVAYCNVSQSSLLAIRFTVGMSWKGGGEGRRESPRLRVRTESEKEQSEQTAPS